MKCRTYTHENVTYLVISCAGCGSGHALPIARATVPDRPRWDFNGNMESPTLTPSIKVAGNKICHFTLTDGVQHFHGDDSSVPNQNLSLPELDH